MQLRKPYQKCARNQCDKYKTRIYHHKTQDIFSFDIPQANEGVGFSAKSVSAS